MENKENIANEFVLQDQLRKRRKEIHTFNELVTFLKYVKENCNCGYGEAPRSIAQAALAVAWYLADRFGITGFQAGFVMWDFVRDWQFPHNKCGLRILDYDEMLYPQNYRYLSDLLGYVAIGARSVENQKHRLTASGLDIPVGMKNPTAGDISVMMNSITAAQHSHMFLYRGWEVKSSGNPHAHAILRGYVDTKGQSAPNYHFEDLMRTAEMYAKSGLQNPGVIVDTNHANSGKQCLEQVRIAKDVLYACRHSSDVKKLVKGLMIESYIEDGAQKIGPDEIYGKSITDPCLGWEKTERLIYDIADLL